MVRTFSNVRIGLMVGIGGGVPTQHDIRLGDLVVSSPDRRDGGVIQYDYGKAIQCQGLLIKGSLNQPPTSILTAMTKLRATNARKGHKIEETIQVILEQNPRLTDKYQRLSPDKYRLYKADFLRASPGKSCLLACHKSNLIPRDARSSREDNLKIHYGLVTSGNQVMKDAVIRDRLSADEEVLCFEMESAGLNNHFPCVIYATALTRIKTMSSKAMLR
jgi:nucleoside phosphorylase